MTAAKLKLQQILEQLPEPQVEEVIAFAEFLSQKIKNGSQKVAQSPFLQTLDLPVVREIKFVGDPFLRRGDLYDESGR
ncbi:DUF2281 domain-containing protein [candidate division KSB1 bacterium]|nr:DUF2281 domain-containing protein [candidate division KSB1 bacterium]